MHMRLFLFLVALVLVLLLGVLAILFTSGVFIQESSKSESEKLIANKLSYASRHISAHYGRLSVQAIQFSHDLSQSIENSLQEKGLSVIDLPEHPQLLEEILAQEYDQALSALQSSQSSGVFIILDATFNPRPKNANTSRAGLYLKNMEPDILSSSSPTILLLRGYPDIARHSSVSPHAQWNMEFDISEAPYYKLPMEQAARHDVLSLSRFCYWSSAFTLPETREEIMLCSVPLIDSRGNVFGVCGFEVSSRLFKLEHMPDQSDYSRIFFMLAPLSGNKLDTSGAMFSGDYSEHHLFRNDPFLHIEEKSSSFSRYTAAGGNSFLGFHTTVKLYPQDTVFVDEVWTVSMMVPSEDVEGSKSTFNLRLALWLTFLLFFGIVLSYYLSRYYIIPVTRGLDMIKSESFNKTHKTRVTEIDELIEPLSAQRQIGNQGKYQEEDLSSAVLSSFISKIKTLSRAERAVLNLYAQGYNAKEIAGTLHLSINTIKTHTKRIYTKLEVSSRKELLLLVNMLKEAGKDINNFPEY